MSKPESASYLEPIHIKMSVHNYYKKSSVCSSVQYLWFSKETTIKYQMSKSNCIVFQTTNFTKNCLHAKFCRGWPFPASPKAKYLFRTSANAKQKEAS